jgi:hypothetical protein
MIISLFKCCIKQKLMSVYKCPYEVDLKQKIVKPIWILII